MLRSFPLALALVLSSVTSVWAADGVLEINQACATQTGCFPWDAPGFPVTLGTQMVGFDAQASYRLTSDLMTPNANASALEIAETHVAIDLNGFALRGYVLGSGVGSGIVGSGSSSYARISNGTIRGFRNKAIDLPQSIGVRVLDLTISSNSHGGIDAGPQSLLRGNVVEGNGDFGVLIRDRTLFRDNVVTDTFNGPDALLQAGADLGGNLCGDGSCVPSPLPRRRRFYLTLNEVSGSAALNQCAAGFHMASRWELWDVSLLEYDTALGFNNADSGLGPPTTEPGWARTGSIAAAVPTPNCNVWTTSSSQVDGTRIGLTQEYRSFDSLERALATPGDPWYGEVGPCSVTWKVWCVED